MKELILVKLGGSVITDKSKPYTARYDVIKRLAKEIKEARQEKNIDVIVGHGGGSFPHVSANEYQVQKGIINKRSWEGFARVQNDAAKLNRIIIESFIEANENAVAVQPSSSCIAENKRIISWDTKPIKTMLENGLLPVPYGDVALDTKQGCCIVSTEEVLGYIAKNLGGKKVIIVGKVDGVLDNEGNVIKEITSENFNSVKKYLNASDAVDVTGGMMHKVERMMELAKHGIESVIINGLKQDNLKNALLGKEVIGTIIK